MVVIPDSDIYLLKSPLQIDNKNQLTFTNAAAQFNYFSNLEKIELTDASYQRKDNAIRFEGNFDDLINFNYCMYKNTHYSNKWFYAFIVGMEYKNDNCTYVYIKTDVWQSWQFDIEFKASYIEREMISKSSDVPGANLLPEALETGEYKINATANIEELEPYFVTVYSKQTITLRDPVGTDTAINIAALSGGSNNEFEINGIPTNCYFLCCDTLDAYKRMAYSILNIANQSDYVVANFTIPKAAAIGNLHYLMMNDAHTFVIAGMANATTKTLNSTPTTLDGYTPVNAKLRQFPYVYIGFNPPQGSSKVFRYEDFANGTPSFKVISEVNPNPTVNIIPQNYRGQNGDSLNDLVSLNGYPQLSSKVDVYNSWLAQNTGIINIQKSQAEMNKNFDIISSGMSIFGGAAGLAASGSEDSTNMNSGGGLVGGVVGVMRSQWNYDYYIKQLNAQKERQALLPDEVSLGGSNATLLGYGYFENNIFTRYSIKYQFAKRVDDFFSMFGYQTNELKMPNINNRSNWNYVKTAGANIIGTIPETDLQEIRNMFDSGVTLWHTTTHFLDYSQSNN